MRPFERILLWSSLVATVVTGTVYGVMKYLMTSDDPYAVVNHPLQPLMLKLHIVTVPFMVFAVGLVFTQHIYQRWRSGRSTGRGSGVLMVLTFAPMVISGYLIQAITWDSALFWTVAVHLTASAVYCSMFVAHRVATIAAKHRERAVAGPTSGGPVLEPIEDREARAYRSG